VEWEAGLSLKQHPEKWIDAEGIRTRYFEAGDGPPVVFMHGGTIGDASGGANAEDWEFNFPALVEAGFRCFSIDKLGQGYTENPKRLEDWSMRGQVAHAASFLRAIGAGPCHLVGHSRGGYVSCRVTLDHPELVQSCVIIDSNTGAPGVGRNEIVFAGSPYPAGTVEAATHVYNGYAYRTDHVTADWIALKQKIVETEKNREAVRRMSSEGLFETVFQPSLRVDREEMFEQLDREGLLRPTLLVWGFNDPTAPIDLGYRLHELISRRQPRCQLHVLNEAGHHSFRERPQEFNRTLIEFFEGVAHGD